MSSRHAVHEPGIIYRDLMLDIVLLNHEGHVKLTEYEMYASAPATLDYGSAYTGARLAAPSIATWPSRSTDSG